MLGGSGAGVRSARWHEEHRKVENSERQPKKRQTAGDPFSVDISAEKKLELATWLSEEIEGAYDARVEIIGPGGLIDYAHWLYEQGQTPPHLRRFPGSADLNSWIVTEKVDAIRARVVKTIHSDPFSIVEGWGKDAEKAPFVEEFHRWKRKDEGLRGILSDAIHIGLIEQNGIIEIIDRADVRMVRAIEQAAAKLGDDGTLLLGDDGMPQPDKDEYGRLRPPTEGGHVLEVKVDRRQMVRKGPGYRVVSLRDFLFLPGHAADTSDLYGYAKRVWMRVGQLNELAEMGIYDADAVKALGETGERESINPSLEQQGQTLAEQRDQTAEKELWSVLFLADLDGDKIEEWYVATISVKHREILRLKRDDMKLPRFISLTPFRRPGSVYGYSFVLDKMATTAEEHTGIRNDNANRSILATNPPLKRLQGALWDPDEQPWGTGQVIDVRSMEEVQPLVVPDLPASAFQREIAVLQAAERLSGQNDTAVGVQTQEKRTAHEVQQVAVGSAVRVEEVVENIQESLAVLDAVRHELWIRTLSAQPDGMEAPESVTKALTTRGLNIEDGRFTVQILRGNFRFIPHGSVETADKNRMRADWNGFLTALMGMAQRLPPVAMMLQDIKVVKSIVEQALRLYDVPDKQPFIDALMSAARQMQAQQEAEAAAAQAAQQGMLPAGAPAGPEGDDSPIPFLPPNIQALLQGDPAGGVQ